MKKYTIIALVIIVVVLGYMFTARQQKTEDSQKTDNVIVDQVTISDSYKTATYVIEGKKVELGKGTTKYFGNEAKGDLNGDGTQDIAFLITDQPGGSGTFYYVVAALTADGGVVGTNAMFLGDRIAPQSTQIVDGDIVVNFADRKEGEPMSTKPSVGMTSYYAVDGSSLTYTGSR